MSWGPTDTDPEAEAAVEREHPDAPSPDEFQAALVAALAAGRTAIPDLIVRFELMEAYVRDWIEGRSYPHPALRRAIVEFVRRPRLVVMSPPPPAGGGRLHPATDGARQPADDGAPGARPERVRRR